MFFFCRGTNEKSQYFSVRLTRAKDRTCFNDKVYNGLKEIMSFECTAKGLFRFKDTDERIRVCCLFDPVVTE